MKILIILSSYLPDYKAGGPIRTISNLVTHLGDEFEFYILAPDRAKDDTKPYDNILIGKWQRIGRSYVRYLSPQEQGWKNWQKLLEIIDYDLLYLNSFFSSFTIKTLLWRRVSTSNIPPVIIAPRGEFSPGALALKSIKKNIYLKFASLMGLYRNMVWQASSTYEAEEIKNVIVSYNLDNHPVVFVASNLPSKPSSNNQYTFPAKSVGSIKILFLSRIVPKKNLIFALQRLSNVHGQVNFDIYGPLEDKNYWQACQSFIVQLPNNIHVTYFGEVHPQDVKDVFNRYHVFLFPTLGENFGHVILESLSVGCPVIISNQTPWRNLSDNYAGWDLPLDQPQVFERVVQNIIDMNQSVWQQWSCGALKQAEEFINDPELLDANRQLFYTALDEETNL